MSFKVVIKEKKEERVDELLGTVIAYSLLLGLLAKILGFKFKFTNDKDVKSWSVKLGDAFEYTSTKVKQAGLTPDETATCERIVNNAKEAMNDVIREEEENIRLGRASTSMTMLDSKIETIYNKMLTDLTAVVKDPTKAQVFAGPKKTFAALSSGLRTMRIDSLRGFLNSASGRQKIKDIIARHSGRAASAVTDAEVDAVIATFPV